MREKREFRCGYCNRLLGRGEVQEFEIKCPRCKTINHMRAQSPGSEPPEGQDGAENAYQKKDE